MTGIREWLRYRKEEKILREFHKYYVVGCHCGFCGAWVPSDIGHKGWAWTICKRCLKKYGGKKIGETKDLRNKLR